jgi:hypothetical protein
MRFENLFFAFLVMGLTLIVFMMCVSTRSNVMDTMVSSRLSVPV